MKKIHKWKENSQMKENLQMRKKFTNEKFYISEIKRKKMRNHSCALLKRNRRVIEIYNWILKIKL